MRNPALSLCAAALFLALAAPVPAQDSRAAGAVIPLWPEGVPGGKPDGGAERIENDRVSNVHVPTLTHYPAAADRATGAAVVVCPGGGYQRLAWAHEGVETARRLNAAGVSVFLLKYRLVEYGHPAPLQDVLRAIRTVRSRAAEFGLAPDRVGVLGFSAGGHLAASAATMFDAPEGRTGAALDAVSARPDFAVLIYPVITMSDPFTHAGSRKSLLGANAADAASIERMSAERRVTKGTPPTFLVHTFEDKAVPVENSVLFYQAMRAAGVAGEVHLYEKGPHGFGLGQQPARVAEWPDRLEAWMRSHGWLDRPGRSNNPQ